MDQGKIGEFLKELRKEKGITQEQLADKLNVSRRTVSRWETGSNMPDLDVLVELADYYDVDLRDIFNGKRREENMDAELKDTLLQAADYTNELKRTILKRMNIMFLLGTIAMIVYIIVIFVVPDKDTPVMSFVEGVILGSSAGLLLIGCLITSPFAERLMKAKRKMIGKPVS
ncbi:MAG: helix-turn-helix transcriptional regulator [Clostridiales bacterium]|nr:helix-turn-helix transcriptional regulator [Clostridiales bacterium]